MIPIKSSIELLRSELLVRLQDEVDLIPDKTDLGIGPYSAILLSVLSITLLLACTGQVIPLTSFDVVLSSTGTIVYTAGITILAGIIATCVTSQIKELFVLDALYVAPYLSKSRLGSWLQLQSTRDDFAIRRRLRANLGLGAWKDHVVFWPQTLTYLVTGLFTTSLVTGLAPTIYEATENGPQWSAALILDAYTRGSGRTYDGPDSLSAFNWTLSDGSWVASLLDVLTPSDLPFYASPNVALTQRLWTMDASSGTAFTAGGVSVRPGAIGAPFLFNQTVGAQMSGLANLWQIPTARQVDGLYSSGQIVGSEACLPVIARNPVTCSTISPDRSIPSYPNTGQIAIEGCNATFPTDRNRTAGVCLGKSPGEASFVLSVRGSSSSGNIQDYLDPSPSGSTTVCHLDLLAAAEFHNVKLTYLGQVNGEPRDALNISLASDVVSARTPTGLSQYVVSGSNSTCVPRYLNGSEARLVDFYGPDALAFATSASWGTIQDWANTRDQVRSNLELFVVSDVQLGTTTPQLFFPNSKGPVEDVLGAIHGAALSLFLSGSGYYAGDVDAVIADNVQKYNETMRNYGRLDTTAAVMTATRVRVGPGSWQWCIVYLIPEIWALCQISWLLWRRRVLARHRQSTSEKS